jgi:hypothetical protein
MQPFIGFRFGVVNVNFKTNKCTILIQLSVCPSVRPGVDLSFRTSTNGQDLDGQT